MMTTPIEEFEPVYVTGRRPQEVTFTESEVEPIVADRPPEEIVFSEAEGETFMAPAPPPSMVPAPDVLASPSGEPPGRTPSAPYAGILDPPGATDRLFARPRSRRTRSRVQPSVPPSGPPVPVPAPVWHLDQAVRNEEGLIIEEKIREAPPLVPYEGVLDRPRRLPPKEVMQTLTTSHRELLSRPRIPSDKVELFETPEAVRAEIERGLSSKGTSTFLADYKDRWVVAHREIIKQAAEAYDIPAWMLASVAWTEVGGDPPWFDELAVYGRQHVGLDSTKTSFGPVQIQIYRAAQELGYDPENLSPISQRLIIWSLTDPQQNLFLVALHLRRLKDIDVPEKTGIQLSDDDARLIGARFNRGAELSRHALFNLGQKLSYGDALVRRRERSVSLLKGPAVPVSPTR
jgi:hypothetical protein